MPDELTQTDDVMLDTDDTNYDDFESEEVRDEAQSLDPNQLVMSMLQDPDILEILKARREGRTGRLVSEHGAEEQPPETPPAEEPNLDELGLDDPISKKLVGLFGEMLDTKMKGVAADVDQLKQLAQNVERQSVNEAIAEAKRKHPDLVKYQKSMAGLARKVPGLSVEEYYLIAKGRAGELDLSTPSTKTERPSATPRREAKKKREVRRGRRGWNELLADGLDNVSLTATEI
jgi:hypothetical protein